MKASKAPFLVLLNSDTIVTKTWLDRMYRAMTSDQNIGIVSPLSNTASWQSVPKLTENGDWAMNYLPNGVSVERMGELIEKYSGCIHPKVPLLNGFCLMIRRKVIEQIGLFDEENFGRGYGEEDDFVIRLNNAGWKSVVVDDAYLFHAQSKSYTNEGRFELQKHSSANLRKKHSRKLILEKVEMMNPNRVMEGIRARSSIMFEREHYLTKGREDFNNKRVLFVLPVRDAGGGANVILDEAFHMQHMGVNVGIFNLTDYKWAFTKNYSHIDIPFLFGKPSDLVDLAHSYDAVIASAHYSVPWLEPLSGIDKPPILGYYIQGFEPLMYPNDSEEYHQALNSYTYIKEIKRFTKTMWTRNTVLENTGADSAVIGISVNIDLFRPRDVIPIGIKPLTIVAMIRPSSTYRNPDLTVDILREIQNRYKNDVDIWFFGANDIREVVSEDRLNFKWRQLGKLTQVQVAAMMSKADIFTDFSSHQAMGLSALEAMSAGSTVLVPLNGGAVEFVDHQINGMVVNTTNSQSCLNTLEQVIQDNQLRTRIQVRGIHDVVQHFPEKASYNILKAIFT
jgi:glycosyltransferase involved in cell wall biosynthesis